MDNFNLENQYQLCIQRLGLSEDKMHPTQKLQLKQVFFAACGQLLILMRDDISELDEMQGIMIFEKMLQQVHHYFTSEISVSGEQKA